MTEIVGETMKIFSILVIIGILCGIAYWIYSYSKRQAKLKEEKVKEAIQNKLKEVKSYFDKINRDRKITIINTHILLKDKEDACLQNKVRLFELRKVTKSERGGGAIRIAKGVYIGGTKGTSRSYDELREIDKGELILTNKRLIFDGTNNTRDVKLDKIISISESLDNLEIAIEGRDKSQVYDGIDNPYLWKTLIYYIRQIPPTGELPIMDLKIEK